MFSASESITDAFFDVNETTENAPEASDSCVLTDMQLFCQFPQLISAVSRIADELKQELAYKMSADRELILKTGERHEAELSRLMNLDYSSKDRLVVHPSVTQAIFARHATEIDSATREAKLSRRQNLERVRRQFFSFLESSREDLLNHRNKCPSIVFSERRYTNGEVCAKIPNPLKGSLAGARPRDPALLPIVLMVSPASTIFSPSPDIHDAQVEKIKRLACLRVGVLVLDSVPSLSQMDFLRSDVILGEQMLSLNWLSFDAIVTTALANSNIVLIPRRNHDSTKIEFWREVLSFAVTIGADAVELSIQGLYVPQRLHALNVAIAAMQIENNGSRHIHGWIGQQALQYGAPVPQPLATKKVTFNLPMIIRVFLNPYHDTSLGEVVSSIFPGSEIMTDPDL